MKLSARRESILLIGLIIQPSAAVAAMASDGASSLPRLRPLQLVATVIAERVSAAPPVWSADGKMIACGSREGGILVVTLGGVVNRIAGSIPECDPLFVDVRRRMVAFGQGEEGGESGPLRIAEIDGKSEQARVLLDAGQGGMSSTSWSGGPQFSPDGSKLLYEARDGTLRLAGVYETSERVLERPESGRSSPGLSDLRWNRTGSVTAAYDEQIVYRESVESPWRKLEGLVGRLPIEASRGVVWCDEPIDGETRGKLARWTTSGIQRWEVDGAVSDFDVNSASGEVVVSLDKTIRDAGGIALLDPRVGVRRVELVRDTRGQARRSEHTGAEIGWARWSPDGRYLVWVNFLEERLYLSDPTRPPKVRRSG